MAAPPPPHPPPPPPPSSSSSSLPFFCNSCLCELKLFDDVPTTGNRIQKRYYTNCHHVLCQNCKMRNNSQCAACKKPCRIMEINNEMRPFYRTYFEPSVKMRTNLIGAVQFQTVQSEHVTSRMMAQGRQLQAKHREWDQKLIEVKKERADALAIRSKIMIIFNKIREEKKQFDEKKRQKQRLIQEAQQQNRAHQFRQPQQDLRPSFRGAPDWFGDANYNQHQRRGHGQGFGFDQNNYGQANHGWAGGFDAATTAQTNFGETPLTYRPFADATTAGPSHQQPNFMDPFETMNNQF